MEELVKKIQALRDLAKALKKPTQPKMPTIPSIKQPSPPSMTPKKPKQPKLPGISPNGKKDPKKIAQQLKEGQVSNKNVEMLKVDKNGQWLLEKSYKDIADHIFNTSFGWISPEGKFLPNYGVSPETDANGAQHDDVIKLHDPQSKDINESYKKGWIKVGSGGNQFVSGHSSIIGNKLHPATKTLRNIVHEHWSPVTENFTIHHPDKEGASTGAMYNVNSRMFGKTGGIKSVSDSSHLLLNKR